MLKVNVVSLVVFLILFLHLNVLAQRNKTQLSAGLWHDKERTIRYRPDGEDFVIENGDRRFNRALYGTNSGFRVEAGDLPEFGLYMPGMGGNLRFGLIVGDSSKWLIKARHIIARYRPGCMLYEIKDDMLGNGKLYISVWAASDEEGLLIKIECKDVAKNNISLFWGFGGATGKKFSRDGDIGADPESSFYLKPEYCKDNRYEIKDNKFALYYGSGKELSAADFNEIKRAEPSQTQSSSKATKKLIGTFPPGSEIKLSDAALQVSPITFFKSTKSTAPAITGKIFIKSDEEIYFAIQNPSAKQSVIDYANITNLVKQAEDARERLAHRVKLNTPDAYLNTLGGALGIAADAIWEDPSYLHGAVAWRMRLNAWRGAYVADPLGWHDRAKKHFNSYALSQLTSPAAGSLVPDTALHFARQLEKLGTTMFSNGYICRNPGGDFRAHHYDMNLVFIDQLLNHFQWTGDLVYVKEMWPVVQRHLAWEKRNFDSDGDGLYDAYCCIWASDALEYANGGVTHSSAYNYRANNVAAQLAVLIGEDATPYQQEAEKILQAITTKLWMPNKGWYAEYKDFSGNKLVHASAGLWTIYHAIDSHVPDPFKAYQCLRYVDLQIPHIPLLAKGLPTGDYFSLSTTNWMPYTWSINNVALAEMLHTSLAYWQGGRSQEGFKIWKSALLESMYLSASPGGFEQLSFYDAIRGELYRDFADPIGMAGRTLVEGLFGIMPNVLNDTLLVRPGLPQEWDYASLTIPDIAFDFKRTKNQDVYVITPSFPKSMNLKVQVKARTEFVKSILVNGKKANWRVMSSAIEEPMIEISSAKERVYTIEIVWQGNTIDRPSFEAVQIENRLFEVSFSKADITAYYDPQQALYGYQINRNSFNATIKNSLGDKTVFAKCRQGKMEWWAPVSFTVKQHVEVHMLPKQSKDVLKINLQNNSTSIKGKLIVNPGVTSFTTDVTLAKNASKEISVPSAFVIIGSNVVRFEQSDGKTIEQSVINWDVTSSGFIKWKTIDLTSFYNDQVTNIFKNKYLSPRPSSPTLQLPWQGIGNWCYPLTDVTIDDTGLRKLAGENNVLTLPQGIPFTTPGQSDKKNIAFTSQWDNYPDSVMIPIEGRGLHIYFLMAGSTNPMQSRFVNGIIGVQYTDGSEERLELNNPDTWWPIEQDYYTDGFAFFLSQPRPPRLQLKTGLITGTAMDYKSIKGFSNYGIDGGAAIVLDLPLNPDKELKSIKLKTIANEVVIGLMSATIATK